MRNSAAACGSRVPLRLVHLLALHCIVNLRIKYARYGNLGQVNRLGWPKRKASGVKRAGPFASALRIAGLRTVYTTVYGAHSTIDAVILGDPPLICIGAWLNSAPPSIDSPMKRPLHTVCWGWVSRSPPLTLLAHMLQIKDLTLGAALYSCRAT